jgi:hypothetical protein
MLPALSAVKETRKCSEFVSRFLFIVLTKPVTRGSTIHYSPILLPLHEYSIQNASPTSFPVITQISLTACIICSVSPYVPVTPPDVSAVYVYRTCHRVMFQSHPRCLCRLCLQNMSPPYVPVTPPDISAVYVYRTCHRLMSQSHPRYLCRLCLQNMSPPYVPVTPQ